MYYKIARQEGGNDIYYAYVAGSEAELVEKRLCEGELVKKEISLDNGKKEEIESFVPSMPLMPVKGIVKGLPEQVGGLLKIDLDDEGNVIDRDVAELSQVRLEEAKQDKLSELAIYDKSKSVNQFTIDGQSLWRSKEDRLALSRRLEVEANMGKTETTLWVGGRSISLSIEQAKQILEAIEAYAIACYDETAKHRAAIKALSDLAMVEAYDFTVGYPSQLIFNLTTQSTS